MVVSPATLETGLRARRPCHVMHPLHLPSETLMCNLQNLCMIKCQLRNIVDTEPSGMAGITCRFHRVL